MPVVSIYTSLGEDINLPKEKDILSVYIRRESDINNKSLIEIFPDIVDKTTHKEKGIDLFVKISEDINKDTYKKNSKIDKIFSKKNPIITYGIMIVCLIMLVVMYIDGNPNNINTLIKYGANVDTLTKNGEYFRLFTCMFLHIGIIHFVLNMYSLYILGPQVESFFGKIKYLFIYLFSGMCGSILSIAFSHNVISAGASGAIFGLLGCILYFGYYYRAYLGNIVRSQILPIIILNLGIGFMISGIDNAAHIGGLLGGIIASMAVGVPDKSSKFERINGITILVIYTAFIIYLAFLR